MNEMTGSTTNSRRTGRSWGAGAAISGVALWGICCGAVVAQEGGAREEIGLAREALKQHYELQKQIGQEEADWRLSRDILRSRIEAAKAQVEALKADISEQELKTTEADEARLKLVKELEDLDALHAAQVRRIREIEHRIRRVIGLAPGIDALDERIRDKVDRLPDPGADESDIAIPLSERYLNILAISKFIGEFHRGVTVATETRRLAEGREVEVRVLYLGLGQAFFAGGSESDPVAGFGYPTEYGWQWSEKPDAAEEIRALIDIYEGKAVARFVMVPAEIKAATE